MSLYVAAAFIFKFVALCLLLYITIWEYHEIKNDLLFLFSALMWLAVIIVTFSAELVIAARLNSMVRVIIQNIYIVVGIGEFRGAPPTPRQRDPILSFSHLFLLKSVCIGGRRVGAPPHAENPRSATGWGTVWLILDSKGGSPDATVEVKGILRHWFWC